jgi:hypothetical protein
VIGTTTKGDIGVALATADLIRQGYQVLNPVSAVSPFDIVAYKDGQFYRLQVKYRELRDGTVSANIRRSVIGGGRVVHTPMTSDDIDYVVFYCPDNGLCYYIPRSDFDVVAILRVTPPKNNQSRLVLERKDG